jgi:RND family efflux transporter MFP subunit
MPQDRQPGARGRPFLIARRAALVALLTVAAAWLWAHEGHEPLPTRGARTVKGKDGRVVGVILSAEAREALGLRTAVVEKRRVAGRVMAYATLVAPWQAHAFATARLPGRVVKLHAKAGQAVKAGEVLAEVRSADLEGLQQEVLTARADAQLSARTVASLAESARSGATSEQALADARTKHRQNLNAQVVARSKWLSLGLPEADLNRLLEEGRAAVRTLPVRSPVSGTVIHADLAVGKVVEPAEHLFEVVNLSTVWARIGVLERDMHRVEEGQEVELTFPAYSGEVFRSRVQVKGLHLDPTAHLHTVWAELTNPAGREPRLLPGMNGQAHLLVPDEPADEAARSRRLAQAAAAVGLPSSGVGPALAAPGLAALAMPAPDSTVVPAAALIHDGLESYVLVEGSSTPEGSEYLRTPVVVGRRDGEWVEVLGGDVFPGSHVVTRGSHELAGFFVPGVLRLGPEARREIRLRVEKAAPHRVDSVLEVEGAVEVSPDRRAAVSAQLAGTLHAISVERGQEVKAGEEVARVASLELQALQLKLLKAHLELGLAEDTLKRLRDAGRSAPPRAVLEAEGRANSLRQQRDGAARKLRAVGLSDEQLRALRERKQLVDSLPVRSVLAGRVVRFDKVLGQALKAEEALFEVHDLSRPLIHGFVPESALARVRVGQKARVRLTADPTFVAEATVVRSARVFGPESRTLSVWAELNRPPGRPLLHNQLARLSLVLGSAPPALAVPRAAVAREGDRAFVFVEGQGGAWERRAVETSREDDRRVQITRGLAEGEVVAVSGAAALMTAHAAVR